MKSTLLKNGIAVCKWAWPKIRLFGAVLVLIVVIIPLLLYLATIEEDVPPRMGGHGGGFTG